MWRVRFFVEEFRAKRNEAFIPEDALSVGLGLSSSKGLNHCGPTPLDGCSNLTDLISSDPRRGLRRTKASGGEVGLSGHRYSSPGAL